MSSSALSDEEILHWVGEMVEAKLRGDNLTPIAMRPSWGFLSLGMRDVRASPAPILEDARWRAINQAHAEAQKKRKDAKAAKRTKQILTHEKLDERRRQQRKDGLPLEESPSPSLSTNASDEDDEGEMGRGPLDHLPDVGETVPGVLASSPVLLGGGGGAAPGSAVARLGAKADTPEERALGKRAISPVGSAVVVEQVAAGATQLPPQRTEGAPGSIEDQPAPMNMEVVPLLPPPPAQTRVAVAKRQKRPVEVLSLAPLKVLKVSPGSSAYWVAEAQAALQRGAASARVDPKEPATQEEAAEATLTQTREGVLPPREGKAHESDGTGVPLVAEATEVEVPRVSEAEATEAGAPKAAEAVAAGVDVSATTEAMMAEDEAPEITEADMTAVKPSAQEVEMTAAEALVVPLVQGPLLLRESAREAEVYPISSDDTSRAQEVVDAKETELEAEVTRAAEASSAVQTVLETEIGEHEALKSAALSAYEALEVEGRVLAVIASHYIGVDLPAISDGYVLPNDDEEADAAVTKLMEAAEGPDMALATLFEEEVVPPLPSADAGGPEP
ncbi:uncharacterized protein [Miscanthus floridulus]|uniref:uncharacterized protein n=1 Tax=Miscanthus floridulus TaxID=154761 RepID=UPI00345A89A5